MLPAVCAGADGTCVFSAGKYMVIKYAPTPSVEELIKTFPEAELILLEGFKYSEYPKIEVIRKREFHKCFSTPAPLTYSQSQSPADSLDHIPVLRNCLFESPR
ncbi:molybdopterin-guanine dinucleotide biosynthesis protein MobB, partial [Lacrimispora saccharolytica]|nr:molybdopterin-guanine dinucleotide biosynthesis protein MobB [Lacrimispora saccharolytica]